ncbi:MAG: Xaa-Pro peptidase family protein [Candidatus Marinimicrobia bacterium]|jgi:Xaa-Pro aminopeptidase|nr:Xaa-Pro peptidase family protein [Candidatus Neomarinimicrobiota bacterium]
MVSSLYSNRQEKLKSVLGEHGIDGILITNLTNICYICGFTGSSATCLILPEKQYFISDGRYAEQSREQVSGFSRVIENLSHLELLSAKKKNLIPDGLKLGFEGDHLSVSQYNTIVDLFPKTDWVCTKGILEDLQAVKDKSELNAIRTAVEITDSCYEKIIPRIKAGITEKEIANELVMYYRRQADGEAYPPIVAGGPNGALPHAVPTDREFKKGDFIVIDAAAKYAGYHADMTRTPVLGEATDKHREIYGIVREAQESAVSQAKAGVSCKELDFIPRSIISERGYGKYFNHGTGHGLGLEIHTQPRLSKLSDQVLQINNVVTVEPGIYLPGWGGVRIEDDIIIEENRCEVLNTTTRELVVL